MHSLFANRSKRVNPSPLDLLSIIDILIMLCLVLAISFLLLKIFRCPKWGEVVLASGYWKIPVNPKHVHKAAFATHLGLYEFLCMPYGLKTVPQTFQHVLYAVFAEFLYQWLIIYIDDCIIWSSSQHEALTQYDRLLATSTKSGVQFKPSKCYFFSENLEVFGHCITPEGRFSAEKGTEDILSMPCPHNVSSIKRFLGLEGYSCDHVRNMSTRTVHLHSLLQKETPFIWTSADEAELLTLKTP